MTTRSPYDAARKSLVVFVAAAASVVVIAAVAVSSPRASSCGSSSATTTRRMGSSTPPPPPPSLPLSLPLRIEPSMRSTPSISVVTSNDSAAATCAAVVVPCSVALPAPFPFGYQRLEAAGGM